MIYMEKYENLVFGLKFHLKLLKDFKNIFNKYLLGERF